MPLADVFDRLRGTARVEGERVYLVRELARALVEPTAAYWDAAAPRPARRALREAIYDL